MDKRKFILRKICLSNKKGIVKEIRFDSYNTGLNFIPSIVIINDGLSNDLSGESDVEELVDLQDLYNRLTCDDVDALKFNMFPQTVAQNASQQSLENIKIAPSALIDLQPDETMDEAKAEMYKLESSFSYDQRLENTLNRIKNEMHELLSIPNISLQELKGYIISGKSLKALYWQLVTRCEDKFTTWRPALEWMAKSILEMTIVYNLEPFKLPSDLVIQVENVYPLIEDEVEEKTLDMQAVNFQVMSRRAYLKKWNSDFDDDLANSELKQIQLEKEMLEESYADSLGDE